MADVFTKEKRSEIMSMVKSRHNKSTELRLVEFFRDAKIIGWRRNYKIEGKPDFVFSGLKIAIFCDGCFWHGHDCRNTEPKQNAKYWREKIKRNRNRDEEVNAYLTKSGWKVVRIWECELKNGDYQSYLKRLISKRRSMLNIE